MPDFTLEPDEIEPERPVRSSPVHLSSGGLHPTEAVPESRRKGKDAAPVSLPCEACGSMVVLGATVHGLRLALDPQVRTYALSWHHEAQPVLHESRSYPVHHCGAGGSPRGDAP